MNRILKVAKPNIVVMKLLAGGHKKETKVTPYTHCQDYHSVLWMQLKQNGDLYVVVKVVFSCDTKKTIQDGLYFLWVIHIR